MNFVAEKAISKSKVHENR